MLLVMLTTIINTSKTAEAHPEGEASFMIMDNHCETGEQLIFFKDFVYITAARCPLLSPGKNPTVASIQVPDSLQYLVECSIDPETKALGRDGQWYPNPQIKKGRIVLGGVVYVFNQTCSIQEFSAGDQNLGAVANSGPLQYDPKTCKPFTNGTLFYRNTMYAVSKRCQLVKLDVPLSQSPPSAPPQSTSPTPQETGSYFSQTPGKTSYLPHRNASTDSKQPLNGG